MGHYQVKDKQIWVNNPLYLLPPLTVKEKASIEKLFKTDQLLLPGLVRLPNGVIVRVTANVSLLQPNVIY